MFTEIDKKKKLTLERVNMGNMLLCMMYKCNVKLFELMN